MTKKKLLENLNKTTQKTLFDYSYEVIATRKSEKAKYVYILTKDQFGDPEFVLVYRLDINYLCDAVSLTSCRMSGSTLLEYERAIEKE